MRIPHGLRSALASQTSGGGGSSPTTDEYFSDVSLLLYGDGTNGSTAIVDSSSNAHAITVNGDAQISTAQSKFGGASMYFDGTGDYITAPSDSSFDFGTGDFTIEFWMNPSNITGTWQAIISRKYQGSGGWRIYKTAGSNNLSFYHPSGYYSTTNTGLTNGTWHHIAVVRSGSTLTTYVDGTSRGTDTISLAMSPTSADVEIGQGIYTSSYPYEGYLDDIRITKGVARYTSNFTPPTASFSTVTPGEKYFYQNSLLLSADGSNGSTSIVDGSANAHTITVGGNAQISTTQSKFGGSSLYFDGNGDYLGFTIDSTSLSNDFTIEGWVYLTGSSADHTFFNSFPHVTLAISLNRSGSGQTALYIGNGSSWQTLDFRSSGTIAFNTWTHLAVVRHNSVITIYHDGVSQGSTSSYMPSGLNGDARIGLSAQYNSDPLSGYIDDFRITKGVARYTSNFTIPTSEASSTDPYFSNTKLLLNGNGTNGSTDFVDSTHNFVNYANSDSSATNGECPNGGTPYWVDILPASANFHYSNNSRGLNVLHNGLLDTSNMLYWTGSQYGNGNVTQARFDLRNYSAVTSVRIYAEQPYIGPQYHPYEARLLDSNKNVISNTTLVINNSTPQWLTVPVAGSPAFLELYAPTNPGARLYIFGLEVNGQEVISKPITVNGDAQISTTQSKFGGASMKFDGNDSIEVPSSTDLSFGSGDFTIECWAYFNSLPSNMTVANFDGGGSYSSIFFAHLPTLNCYISGNGTSWNVLAGNSLGTPSTGVWHHLALVREGNFYKGFLDGVLGFSVNNSSGPYGSSALARIGNAHASLSQGIDGYIDDFRITKGVARYGNFTPPTAGFSTLTPVEPYFHNNSLLMHGDGTNGSTTFEDDSINNHSITAYGNAQISTTQSKFGGASMYFDGSGDYLQIAQDTSTDLSDNDFTIEAWIRPKSVTGTNTIFSQWNSGASGPIFYLNGANLVFAVYRNGGGAWIIGSTTLSVNTWYHVAVVRSGSTIKTYINGQLEGSMNYTLAIYTHYTNVGRWRGYADRDFEGYIDDFRLTKGVARYTANFTPPTSALPSL